MKSSEALKSNKSKIQTVILFSVIIVCLCIRMFVLYGQRVSHHLDEAYSYGFANNPGEPWFIHPGVDENGNEISIHYGGWFPGEDLWNFLVVNDGERFDFASVVENKLGDNSPSNYELLLHFVCSLFPNTFSLNYAFAVNLFFYIGSLIVLVLINLEIFKDYKNRNLYTASCVLFFALSISGTGAYTFFRMYGVLSFYSLLVFYLIQKICTGEKKTLIKCALLMVASFFGFFTHLNFIVYAFCLTVSVCVYLLLTKKFKKMISVGITELLSVILFFVIYPYPLQRVEPWMSNENSDHFSYFTRLNFSNMHMFGESIGFYIPFTVPSIIWWIGVAAFVAAIIAMIFFLFRKEKWFPAIKDKTIPVLKDAANCFKKIAKKSCPWLYVAIVTAVMYMLFINAIAPIMTTKGYVTRYFFIGMHFVIIAFVGLMSVFYDVQSKKVKYVVGPALIILSCYLIYNMNFNYGNPFLLTKPFDRDEEIVSLVDGADVMIFSSEPLDLYSLIVPLRTVDEFYFITVTDWNLSEDDIPEGGFYVMVDKDTFPDEEVVGAGLGGFSAGGTGLAGSIDDYLIARLDPAEERTFTFVRNYNTFAGEYKIYYVE